MCDRSPGISQSIQGERISHPHPYVLLHQVAQMDQATVKMTALQVIFDLLHLFGLEAFNVDSEHEEEEADSANDSGT